MTQWYTFDWRHSPIASVIVALLAIFIGSSTIMPLFRKKFDPKGKVRIDLAQLSITHPLYLLGSCQVRYMLTPVLLRHGSVYRSRKRRIETPPPFRRFRPRYSLSKPRQTLQS